MQQLHMPNKCQDHFHSVSHIEFLQGPVDGRTWLQFSASEPSHCVYPRLQSLEPLIIWQTKDLSVQYKYHLHQQTNLALIEN